MRYWLFIFCLLIFLGTVYVFFRMWRLLPLSTGWRVAVLCLLAVCLSCLFAQFTFDIDRWPMWAARTVYEVGNSSLFILMYSVILFLVLDLLRLVHVVPSSFLSHSWRGTITVLGILVVVFVGAYFQYMHKCRRVYRVETLKEMPRPMRVVLLSDLHLGYHNTRQDLHKWVDMINAEHPDLILLAGDVIDRSVRPLREEKMAEEFHRLQAPVYGVFGNHEYFCGRKDALQFYADAGINIINDRAVKVGPFGIIGRDDFSRVGRMPLEQLVPYIGYDHFTFVLDHQPVDLEEAHRQNIDFQFSGHTHNGQMWPINWIERLMYDDAYGPAKRGQTNYYVSSGIGQWGAKFRIGSRSEYVVLNIEHKH